MSEETPRQRLLIHMYDQMFNDINTHIMVVWQSVAVLVGAFALLALIEKQVITLDLGATLLVLICAWLLANLLDASYWYNRNLAIIGNIEKEFLMESDLKDVIYYFAAHRPDNKMITHLRIQWTLGISLSLVILLFHFFSRIVPGFSAPWTSFDPWRAGPYAISVAAFFWLRSLAKHRNRSYLEFIKNSPGRPLNSQAVELGEGHGFPRQD